jgi:subtilisin family serine protease
VAALGAPTAAPLGDPPSADLIVGFEGPVNATLIASLGGVLIKQDTTLRLAGVATVDPAAFSAAIALHPQVSFVEPNGPTRIQSTGWDSTGWDSTGWDSTGWDSTGWDSTGWDSTGWDSTGWDSTGWDSTGWDSTGWDSTGWDSTGWDSTGWDSTPTAPGTSPDSFAAQQWGYRAVNGPEAAALFAGTKARNLCVVDTGVDPTHPDLAPNLWRPTPLSTSHGRDFVNQDDDPRDDAGHGTHVAGIAAAVLRNGHGIAGVAQERIMAAKVLDANGTGEEIDLAMGIGWCAKNGAHVITMSLGTSTASQAVHRAVQYAADRGIVLVASAGNGGPCGCVHYPAAYPEVISVGAVMPNGMPAPYTTVSDTVDISAPGYRIASTLPGGRFGALNGTSQAAPFVAGAAALLMDANPNLSPNAIANMLKASALAMGPPGPDPYYGAGVLDVEKALRAAGRT